MKHARILAAILLAGTATAALAQDFVLRDASGRRTGTIESSGGDYIRRDAPGAGSRPMKAMGAAASSSAIRADGEPARWKSAERQRSPSFISGEYSVSSTSLVIA